MTPPNGYLRIEYNTKSDDYGRCSFFLFWEVDFDPLDPERKKGHGIMGQGFYADPREYGFPRPEEVNS